METIGSLRVRYREEAMKRKMNPRDIDLLLADLLGKPITYLISHGEEPVVGEIETRLASFVERRFGGEPLQYIRGRAEFYGREFLVDRRVLIPRPETELLAELTIDRAPPRGRVLDVGTGSGCVAVTLSLERRDVVVDASDRSLDALLVARANARRLHGNVRLAQADALSAIRGCYALIVSNPPYIPETEMDGLQVEVRDHEPRSALTPGGDGLSLIRTLLLQARERLSPGGVLMMEIGFGQRDAVETMANELRWGSVEFFDDLAGIPRVVIVSP